MENKIFKILYCLIFVFFVLNIFLYVKLLNFAKDISIYENEIKRLELENARLESEIFKNSSFEVLEKKAKAMGFQEPVKVVNLGVESIALEQ